MRNVTHPEHQDACHAGYSAAVARIQEAGWNAAHAEFQAAHPVGYAPAGMAAYYEAEGQFQALFDNRSQRASK